MINNFVVLKAVQDGTVVTLEVLCWCFTIFTKALSKNIEKWKLSLYYFG